MRSGLGPKPKGKLRDGCLSRWVRFGLDFAVKDGQIFRMVTVNVYSNTLYVFNVALHAGVLVPKRTERKVNVVVVFSP